ncbi:hypothetical protein K0B90_06935 [bacterium]|nr:hypothetical protein [bacterium]
MGRRASLVLILPVLLLTAAGCTAKREALRPDGASSSVQARVPAAEAIGVRLERDGPPAPPILLPLTEADKAGVRTLAAPGVGWLMLIQVDFSISPPPREPAEREESAEAP